MSHYIVVGGGLIGMLSARELRAAGAAVTLIERRETGRESTWAGGGILSPLHPWRYPDPVTTLARWSQGRYQAVCRELAERSGVDPEWTPSGLLVLESGEESEAEAWARRFGYTLERLEPDAVARVEPALGEAARRALWMPDIAQVRNPRLARSLRGALESAGVDILEHTPVESLLVEQGRAVGVRTAAGERRADAVVVAGGAWSAGILGPYAAAIDVEPVRGQMLLFRAEPGTLRRVVLHESRYVIPRRDGRVLIGSTLEHAGFDKSTTPEAREELAAEAARLVPGLAEFPVEAHWAGLRPGAPNGVPFIGEHPDLPGLFVNAGQYRNGVVIGLASARLLSDLVLGRDPIVDPHPYRLGRARRA